MDMEVLITAIIVFFGIFVACFLLMSFRVAQLRRKTRRELSQETGVYTGPAGEPQWDGKLPEKVDNYTEPRYVYENLVESTAYLPKNGRIIGYRISPVLVIHSRVIPELHASSVVSYMDRLGGRLIEAEDMPDLIKNWNEISRLRKQAGDSSLNKKEFFGSHQGLLVVYSAQSLTYKDISGFREVWAQLILKR